MRGFNALYFRLIQLSSLFLLCDTYKSQSLIKVHFKIFMLYNQLIQIFGICNQCFC